MRPSYKATITIELPDWADDNGYGTQDFSLCIDIELTCPARSEAFDYQAPWGLATQDADKYSPDEDRMTIVEVTQNNYRIDQDGGDHSTDFELNYDDNQWLDFVAKYHVDSKGKPLAIDWEVV